MTAQSAPIPVHRASLEAFRQGDPEWVAYLERYGRVEVIDEKVDGSNGNKSIKM